MKKGLIPILLILFFSILVSLPLLKPGLFIIHDDQQIARLLLFDQALKAGQFPPRWVDELGFGFGYPLFVFYPPLVYMVGELFHLIGFSFIDSIKLVFFTSIFASGLAMYILVKEFWGRYAGIVSAFFYILVPYRAIDVYIRGALAESFSFVWLPVILWSFYKLVKTNKTIYIYLSAVFLALLMITHNLIFLPFMLILPFYLLFLIWKSNTKILSTAHCLLSTVLALGLSAFFWAPAILEKKFTIVDQLLLVNLANYNIHFVFPQQLWNWPWGFGGSAAGLADGISFKIGKLHIVLSVMSLFFAIIYLVRNKLKSYTRKEIFNFQFSIFNFFLFVFSAFMTTSYSKLIWDLVSPLGYLQFPWRFLIFTSLFSSILAGAFIYLLKLPILRLIASLILITLLVVTNFKLFKPQTYRPDLTDEIATSKKIINWDVSRSSFEYVPVGLPLYKSPNDTNLLRIGTCQIPREKVRLIQGTTKIENLKGSPSKIQFTSNAQKTSPVRVNVFNFPGWQAKIDGQKTIIQDNNPYKLITIDVPEGSHQIEVVFTNTPVRTQANTITIGTIITMIIIYILRLRCRNIR